MELFQYSSFLSPCSRNSITCNGGWPKRAKARESGPVSLDDAFSSQRQLERRHAPSLLANRRSFPGIFLKK
ncbi:hypothetical protein BDQ12DRAFT_693748 [Crucibulum laeve]|uniref:Uncharacterized protein n=1 Tax=Crucibulum laeve TaxID=68775 RepID=A0A5C3LFX1_9AGAR|nr:hypothetical protein BDQ12DRAFT_693748 [Crucibulum laeve]